MPKKASYLQQQACVPVISTAPRKTYSRSSNEMTFDPRIPMEMAAQLRHPQEVLRDFGYTGKDAFTLVASSIFQADLKRSLEEISVSGLSFRQRARMMAPDMLEEAYDMAKDKEISPAVRANMIQWIPKMADLEPREVKNPTNNAFVLNIDLGR